MDLRIWDKSRILDLLLDSFSGRVQCKFTVIRLNYSGRAGNNNISTETRCQQAAASRYLQYIRETSRHGSLATTSVHVVLITSLGLSYKQLVQVKASRRSCADITKEMKFLLAPAVQLAICLGCILRCSEAYQSTKYTIHKSHSLRMMAATMAEKKRVVIVGATGYIGKFVVKESIRRGLTTTQSGADQFATPYQIVH